MNRFMAETITSKQASKRLTAIIVAVVFAMGTLFVPTGGLALAAETDEDGAVLNEAVEAETTAAGNELDEAADADTAETAADETDMDGIQADAEASDAMAELEELVVVQDEDGEAAALEDLDESDYDGFIYKLEDDVTKGEIKKMETAIDGLGEDPESGEAEEIINNELYAADSLETIEEVAKPDMIEYIEPDYVTGLMGTNDYYYEGDGWFLEMIKAPYVWEKEAFGEGVVVAVLDTGVMTSHPDFENTSFVDPYNTFDDSNDVTDTNGHGTGMAGIIAASYNNAIGLTGIMPKASIMPIKIFGNSEKSTHSMLIKGINYASEHGADVINMSIGDAIESPAMNEACRQAAAKGAVLVAAAGNSGNSTAYYPASYSSVVSVGSIETDGAHYRRCRPFIPGMRTGRNVKYCVHLAPPAA